MAMPLQDQNNNAIDLPAVTAGKAFAFGNYRLFPERRLLFAGDRPLELGSRAFEAVLALVEARGALVTRKQLCQRLWPDTNVEPHNLDQQMSMLRKALGADRDLIRTETGRGWRLATPVKVVPVVAVTALASNLPVAITPLIGREHELSELPDLITAHRFLTLTGAGGIGKTQLALEVARRVLGCFGDGAWLVEFGPFTDPQVVPSAIARTLSIEPELNGIERLAIALERKHLLLVLDNCEHIAAAVAPVVESLLHRVPRLHILATSQETLNVDGERIHGVMPLKVPLASDTDAASAMEHSAVQLFVERAKAADSTFVLDDQSASVVSRICRRLDGIPLAIELAAARVAALGIDAVAKRLDDRFRLLTGGRRTALLRHQTLAATLDWSYGLLSEAERAVLRRLAIFAGSFTLESAGLVAADGDRIDQRCAEGHILDLVRKSLVAIDFRASARRYRLLETTRAYAVEKLAQSSEFAAVARRHASYYRELLEQATPSWRTTPAPELVARYAPDIDNIRTALSWALDADGGDPEIGVALTAAAVPLWMLLSLLGEYPTLIDTALSHLEQGAPEQRRYEMVLQTALGHSSIWGTAAMRKAGTAAARALDLAQALGDAEYQLHALYMLWVHRLRAGEYRSALSLAQRFRQVAETDKTDLLGILAGVRLEGAAAFYLGDFAATRAAMDRVVDKSSDIPRPFVVRLGVDQRILALTYSARVFWLQGFPDKALQTARAAVEEAHTLNHAYSLCLALSDGGSIAAMSGDVPAAQEFESALADCAEKHGFSVFRQADGLALRGWIALSRGDKAGLRLLRSAIDDVRGLRVELRHTIFLEALTQSLAATKRAGEGVAIIQKTLEEASRNGGRWCLAELLRLRGELMLCDGLPAATTLVEKDFLEALDIARQQGARSWQLRVATSLARLRLREGRHSEALGVLVPVLESFTEGFETTDLKTARALVETL
jgi:predicted ATPase/DNA-binding winged helix-turn-helix (wHTH) protein